MIVKMNRSHVLFSSLIIEIFYEKLSYVINPRRYGNSYIILINEMSGTFKKSFMHLNCIDLSSSLVQTWPKSFT